MVVTGEFGRTPKIERVASGAAGTVQPGRDHWPRAFSQLWAGGGITTGGVIGATDKHGEEVVQRAVRPGDFLATLYQHLGIAASEITIPDFSGRPNPILARGEPIPELARRV